MAQRRMLLSGLFVLFGSSLGACDTDQAESTSDSGAPLDAGTSDTGGDSGTGGAVGECRPYLSLDPLFEVTVDGSDQAPLLNASCRVRSVDAAGERTLVILDCVDREAAAHVVELGLGRTELPASIVPGAAFELNRTPDLTSTFGPGHELRMRDAAGLVLAQIEYAADGVQWGPFEFSYASHCPPIHEEAPEQTESGFVRVFASGSGVTHEAFVGDFVDLQEAGYAWQVHAFYTFALCCHPPSFGVTLLRRPGL